MEPPRPLPAAVRRAGLVLAVAGWLAAGGGRSAAAPAPESPPPVNVVLVHGIFDRGRIFDPLVRRLEAQGCHCLAPSLVPNDCRDGIRPMAQQLSTRIDARFGPSQPIVLVGFSMGGLVTRDYVQNLAAPGRVRAVFLISTPNHGTLWASMARGSGTKQLSYNSPFIQELNRHDAAWRHLSVHSYWTPCDLMVVPASSCRWPVGDTRRVFCLLHPWMVRQPEVMDDIATKIAALTSTNPPMSQRKAKTGRFKKPG